MASVGETNTWLGVGVINPGKVSVIGKTQENGYSNSGVN